MRKRIIAILLLLMMVLNSSSQIVDVQAATTAGKKYLVLVEATKGQWIAYDNLVRISDGKPVISAEIMARALGYLYEAHTNSTEQIILTKSNNVSNTYTVGKKYYTYQSGKTKSKISTKSKAAVRINNLYYCDPESLGKLCYYSYFSGNTIKTYNKYSDIDGIYCFSTVKKAKSLPKYNQVYTPNSQLWYKTFVDLNVKEVDSVELYGVTFPRRDHFLEVYETKEDINRKRFPVFQAIKDKSIEYSEAYRKANNINISYSGSFEFTADKYMTFAYAKETHNYFYAFAVQNERINGEDYWCLNITTQFQPVEADLNALKAVCYLISCTPETLYKVITYDLYEFPVVPGIPGVVRANEGDGWIGELCREYGDFAIYTEENMNVYTTLDTKNKNLYPHVPFLPLISYYIKKA
jgi:hypothetical protein